MACFKLVEAGGSGEEDVPTSAACVQVTRVIRTSDKSEEGRKERSERALTSLAHAIRIEIICAQNFDQNFRLGEVATSSVDTQSVP